MALDSYSGIPELSGEANAIARRRKIAEMMMAQSQEQLPVNQMAGQVVAPVSWTQGLAKLANAYLGKKQADEADKAEQGLASKRQQLVAEELNKVRKIAEGIPGVEGIEARPERTIQAPAPMQPNQVAPNYGTVPETVPAVAGREAVPAVAGDTRKAIIEASMNRLPEVQQWAEMQKYFEAKDTATQDKKDAALQAFQDKKELLEMQLIEGRISKDEANKKHFENQQILKQMGIDAEARNIKLSASLKPEPSIKTETIADPTNPSKSIIIDVNTGRKIGDAPLTSQQTKAKQNMPKDKTAVDIINRTSDSLLSEIDKLIGSEDGRVKEHPGLRGSVGYFDSKVPPASEAQANAQALIRGLLSKTSVQGLQSIRQQGSAPGSITEKEWPIFQNYLKTIDPSQGEEQFIEQLKELRILTKEFKDSAQNNFNERYSTENTDGGASNDKLFSSLEEQYKLPSGLLNAVMMQESRGNANAVSPKGAQGYFQFMPDTAKQYGVNPSDLTSSATGAARMFADLLKQNNGDLDSALAGYNWGQGNLSKYGIGKAPNETRNYIAKVKQGMGASGAPAGNIVRKYNPSTGKLE